MNPVKKSMQEQPVFAQAWGKALALKREKPLIRCETCTKTAEDTGRTSSSCYAVFAKQNFCSKSTTVLCTPHPLTPSLHPPKSPPTEPARNKTGPPTRNTVAYSASPKNSQVPRKTHFWNSPSTCASHPHPVAAFPSVRVWPRIATVTYSPALQRQMALLRADRETDYFLFDAHDRLVRFAAPTGVLKMTFRMMRSDALGEWEELGVEATAEYMKKVMGPHPGLRRERISAQLQREYGADGKKKVDVFVKAVAKMVPTDDETFLEGH